MCLFPFLIIACFPFHLVICAPSPLSKMSLFHLWQLLLYNFNKCPFSVVIRAFCPSKQCLFFFFFNLRWIHQSKIRKVPLLLRKMLLSLCTKSTFPFLEVPLFTSAKIELKSDWCPIYFLTSAVKFVAQTIYWTKTTMRSRQTLLS